MEINDQPHLKGLMSKVGMPKTWISWYVAFLIQKVMDFLISSVSIAKWDIHRSPWCSLPESWDNKQNREEMHKGILYVWIPMDIGWYKGSLNYQFLQGSNNANVWIQLYGNFERTSLIKLHCLGWFPFIKTSVVSPGENRLRIVMPWHRKVHSVWVGNLPGDLPSWPLVIPQMEVTTWRVADTRDVAGGWPFFWKRRLGYLGFEMTI